MVQYFSQTHWASGLSQVVQRMGPGMTASPSELYLSGVARGKARNL
jgi:hypothetical protein